MTPQRLHLYDIDLKGKRVLVTGSDSMLGAATRFALMDRGAIVCSCSHKHVDLLDFDRTYTYFYHSKPDYIIHLATYSGNISFNKKYPADTFYKTAQIGLNVLTAAKELKVQKVVSILSSCAIADQGKDELYESDLWKGQPNSSIESHGFAKRNLDAYSRQLYHQHGLNYVCCILNNSFGPKDHFDLEKTKVVGALIKRFVDAKKANLPNVECWGTGSPLREFIYSYDAGEGIVQVLEKYNDSLEPINITADNEISIKDLTELIVDIVGYKGEVTWDITKGDGQMRKKLNTDKMNQYIKINYTPMRQALEHTIKWYIKNVKNRSST
jgi:GDP-L-fucose synthase